MISLRSWRDGIRALGIRRFGLAVSAAITLLAVFTFIAINFVHSPRTIFLFLDNVELLSLDARFQFRGPLRPDPNIVIVAVDQKTIDRLGWPFSRSHYGRVLQTLTRDRARAVGIDVVFAFPDRSGSGDSDAQFAKAIHEAGNVVLSHLFLSDRSAIQHMSQEQIKANDEGLAPDAYPFVLRTKSQTPFPFYLEAPDAVAVETNLPVLTKAAEGCGAINFDADNDGTFRRTTFIFRYKGKFYPSLDVQIARLVLGAGPQTTAVWFNPAGPEWIDLGPQQIYPDVSGRALINFAGPAHTYPYYSFADVAGGLTPQDTFRNKIVLVGATATGIGDLRPTPFVKQGYPGIEIHANVVDNILHDRLLHRGIHEELTDLYVILFCGFVMGIVFLLARPLASLLFLGFTVIAVAGFIYYNFAVHGRWLSLILPEATLILNYLGLISYRAAAANRTLPGE